MWMPLENNVMKKTTLFLIILSILIITAATITFFISKLKESEKIGRGNQQLETYPTQNLPAEQANKISPDVILIEKPEDQANIKKSYDDYVNQVFRSDPFVSDDQISLHYPPVDKKGSLVNINALFNAIGAKINPKLGEIAGERFYGFQYCMNERLEKEYSLILDTSDTEESISKNNIIESKEAMLQWEPFLLKDLHSILFPGVVFQDNLLNQKFIFKDGEYRYTDLILPGGKSSINYFVDDYPRNKIIISTSQNCLKKSLEYFAALD
jgi:hypothetical protein